MNGDVDGGAAPFSVQSGGVLAALNGMMATFGKAERRVAEFIVGHPDDAVEMNVGRLAKACSCSESTVVRMCQRAGFKGYYQLRLLVAREVGDDSSTASAASAVSFENGGSIERATNAGVKNLTSLNCANNIRELPKVVRCMRSARKVIVCAAGNTSPIAQDLSFRLNRFNIESYTSTIFENVFNYISNSNERDALVAISKSGANTLVTEEVAFAKRVGLRVIAITGDIDSRLASTADYVLLSGKPDDGLVSVQKGLQSHVSDLCLVDAIMYGLIDVSSPSNFDSSEAAEFELAGWKE